MSWSVLSTVGVAGVAVYYIIAYYRMKELAAENQLKSKLFTKLLTEFRQQERYVRSLEKVIGKNLSTTELANALNRLQPDSGKD